jgi:Peptidase family M49
LDYYGTALREEKMRKLTSIFLLLGAFVIPAKAQSSPANFPDAAELRTMAAQFAPTTIKVDTSRLSSGDHKALVKLVEAARILNSLFMKQYWNGDLALYRKLQEDTTPLGRVRLHYFWINKGPWDNLNGLNAFLPGVPARKPLGANFYPEDMTKEQFEHWVASLPPNDQEQAKGFFTVIRWKATPGGDLKWTPYSEEYKSDLTRAASLLREAAALTDNASLKKFLDLRAQAFLSNDYYQSDLAWMDLDAPLDITIGPYETYNDELFGYKAAFEAYITLRDEAETAKLSAFTKHLQEIENNLPEDPKYRNPKLGAAAPIRVVDEIIATGDGAHGVQTAAYNLPNDDRVVQQKGSKRVMLKNVQEAKFHGVLLPIAQRTLAKSAVTDVKFEPFFTHILAHELMHGLGPHQIEMQGRQTTPREELKELFSAIEEAKADVTGLFALQYMMDHAAAMGVSNLLPTGEAAERQLYTTFLASSFRSLRFGLTEAHGKGMAVQFNFYMDKGGFVRNSDGTFSVNVPKMKAAVRELDHELLTVEAEGNYAGAKKMLDDFGVVRPELKQALDRLQGIPIDIEPIYVTADELAPQSKASKTSGVNSVAGSNGPE